MGSSSLLTVSTKRTGIECFWLVMASIAIGADNARGGHVVMLTMISSFIVPFAETPSRRGGGGWA